MNTAESDTYKRLFDEIPGAMYIYDHKTYDFLAVNKAALYQYGYSRSEFLAMNAKQIRPKDEYDSFERANREVPEDYYDFGQWIHARKNGEIFYVQIYARTTTYAGKKARLVFAIDVDEKVKSELAIARKNAEIANVLESITDGFFAVNKNWEVTYINKTAEHILHCKRAEIIGKVIWDYFPRSLEGKFYPECLRAMTAKVSVHFEELYEPLGIWGSLNVYPTDDGLAVYFVDITEKKKAQEKIFNGEQNLWAIINNTKDIIWSIDRHNNIISANQAFWDRVSYVTGKHVDEWNKEYFNKELFIEWDQYFQKAFKGASFKIIWEDKHHGNELFEEISFNPILNKDKEVIGISCFSRDITQQYVYTRMIEKQNEQLQQIAWIQSHEVRSPVASLLGLIQLFNKENPGDALNLEQVAINLDAVIRKITDHTNQSGL
jgi:PAS domain S-box-containing protein